MPSFSQYRKAIAALVGSVLTWAGTAYVPDGHVDRAEFYALAVALATAAGVYAVSNTTKDPAPVVDVPPAPTPMNSAPPVVPVSYGIVEEHQA